MWPIAVPLMPDVCATGPVIPFGGMAHRRGLAPSTLPIAVPTLTTAPLGLCTPIPAEAIELGEAWPGLWPPPGTTTPIALRTARPSAPERLNGGIAPIFADGAAGIFAAFAMSDFRLARRCRLPKPPSSLTGSIPRLNGPAGAADVASSAPAGGVAPLS